MLQLQKYLQKYLFTMSMSEYGTDKKLEIKVCYLGIGSNIGDRIKNLKNSIKFLGSEAGKITKYSKIYET